MASRTPDRISSTPKPINTHTSTRALLRTTGRLCGSPDERVKQRQSWGGGRLGHNGGVSDNFRRKLPSVDRLLSRPELAPYLRWGRVLLRDCCREVLEDARRAGEAPDAQELAQRVMARATRARTVRLRYAINATGVVLHTGLGRARLSDRATAALHEAARGHSVLEIDEETGRRGSRVESVRALLRRLTEAEDAHVVNNNAAAVMLCVNTLAAGREAILSRGQSVEIGGSFRMPDVIAAAGAKLVEVGTTNRTRLSDYERAIGPNTGCIVRCHPSNFRIVGFTEEPSAEALATLGRERGVPVLDDVGSGCLVDMERAGLWHEPTLTETVRAGSDLITASGDKLLGGPQAGIILGRAELVRAVARNPIARAVRCDKLTLSALEATLREYLDPDGVWNTIPTLRYISRTAQEVGRLAEMLAAELGPEHCEVCEGVSEIGGGSLPGQQLPTRVVRLLSRRPAEQLARALRLADPPAYGRIAEDAVCLDLRTVEEDEVPLLAKTVLSVFASAAE